MRIGKLTMINEQDFAEREVKYAALNLEAVNRDGVFEGYASLFNTIDLSRDQVMKGAFQKSLAKRPPLSVKLLYQHNPNEPIGIWDRIYEDHKGLYVKGRLLQDISRARDVFTLMKRGALDGLSIGYKTIRAAKTGNGAIRQLLEVDLYEISIVTFPMHPAARITQMKTGATASDRGNDNDRLAGQRVNGLPTIRDFERWLMRDAGLTRRQAQTAIAKGFKSLLPQRDAEQALPDGRERLAKKLRAITQTILS